MPNHMQHNYKWISIFHAVSLDRGILCVDIRETSENITQNFRTVLGCLRSSSIKLQQSIEPYHIIKIHYGGPLLRLLRPWGTRLTTPFPLQTSNRLRFRCTATETNGVFSIYVSLQKRIRFDFILFSYDKGLDQWQWFPSLVSILHLPKLIFAPRGDIPRKIGWACAARFPKPLPYLWPKSVIFPTLFMTW